MADVQLSTLGSVIKTAYEGQPNTNAFTTSEKSKLSGLYQGSSFIPSNVGTRILFTRMGSLDNSVSKTFQVTMAVNQHFDAIRVIIANNITNSAPYMLTCKASVIADASDLNNSSGTWVSVFSSGLQNTPMPISPAPDRVSYGFSDWTPLKSIARTDGGVLPLVTIRGIFDGLATLPVYGTGDDLTNWATKPDGNIWVARQQDGNFVTTTTGFTSTTNLSQSPIIGIQYLSRGKVITVMGVGDSITEGRGTYFGEGFILPSVQSISNSANVAMQYANLGWSGQTTSVYCARALEMLDTPLKPDVLIIPVGSPNDQNSTLTDADIQLMSGNRGAVIAKCKEVGTIPILWTWLPSNSAQKPYGTSDALRVTENSQVMQEITNNKFNGFDASSVVSGSVVVGQVQFAPFATTDGLHPNDAGNQAISNLLTPVLRQVTGL